MGKKVDPEEGKRKANRKANCNEGQRPSLDYHPGFYTLPEGRSQLIQESSEGNGSIWFCIWRAVQPFLVKRTTCFPLWPSNSSSGYISQEVLMQVYKGTYIGLLWATLAIHGQGELEMCWVSITGEVDRQNNVDAPWSRMQQVGVMD